jgi:hypothetical protein
MIVALALTSPALAQSQTSKPQLGAKGEIQLAQQQPTQNAQQAQTQTPAPPKPYKPVSVSPAAPSNVATFEALR